MERRLYRSREDRLIWGVCGGLASYFDIDPLLVRLIFVLFIFTGGISILAYILLAIFAPLEGSAAATPRETTRENIAEIKRSAEDLGEEVRTAFASPRTQGDEDARARRRRNLIGIIIIVIGVVILISSLNIFWWFQWAYFWPVLLIIVGLVIILTARRHR